MFDRRLLVSYKDDHRSLVTLHTVLHLGSGAIIGLVTRGVSPVSAAAIVLVALLGWELFEYWHAPAFGYWTVLNAGNTAMDIAAGIWPFMAVYGWSSWDTAPWTYLLIVAGALVAYLCRCRPYPLDAPRGAYKGTSGPCLMWMLRKRKALYPWLLKGIKDLDRRPCLDAYMAPSRAHQVLAGPH